MRSLQVLAERDLSQLEQKNLARGAWAEGRVDDALLILESVLSEEMSPAVAAECYVTQAAFRGEGGDYNGALQSLEYAALFIDEADDRIKGSFYIARGVIYKKHGETDKAILDLTGAQVHFGLAGYPDRQAMALNNLATLYLKKGKISKARESVDQALAIDGGEFASQMHDTHANVLLAEGRCREAVKAAAQALSLVGENELWRSRFLNTQTRARLVSELAGVATAFDVDALNVAIVRQALDESDGSITRAAQRVGMTHKGVAYIADKHSLQRKSPRFRGKSIITKK